MGFLSSKGSLVSILFNQLYCKNKLLSDRLSFFKKYWNYCHLLNLMAHKNSYLTPVLLIAVSCKVPRSLCFMEIACTTLRVHIEGLRSLLLKNFIKEIFWNLINNIIYFTCNDFHIQSANNNILHRYLSKRHPTTN